MALVTLTSTTWSSATTLTADTTFQAQEGDARLTWNDAAPDLDGFILYSGMSIIVPSGSSVRWAAAGSSPATLHHEPFA